MRSRVQGNQSQRKNYPRTLPTVLRGGGGLLGSKGASREGPQPSRNCQGSLGRCLQEVTGSQLSKRLRGPPPWEPGPQKPETGYWEWGDSSCPLASRPLLSAEPGRTERLGNEVPKTQMTSVLTETFKKQSCGYIVK